MRFHALIAQSSCQTAITAARSFGSAIVLTAGNIAATSMACWPACSLRWSTRSLPAVGSLVSANSVTDVIACPARSCPRWQFKTDRILDLFGGVDVVLVAHAGYQICFR